jgi:hypothetical protein
MRRVLTGIVAILGAWVLTAGCSGSQSLTAVEYRARVRTVCRELHRRSGALPRPEPTAGAELVRIGRRALALQRDALGRIQSLDAPSADERTVGRWLDFVDASLDAGAASLAAQSNGDLAAARAANARGNTATAHADELARLLRIDDCATPVTG